MKKFYLSYSIEKNNGLVLKITPKGESCSRRVRVLSLLPCKNPNLSLWDSKTERFKETSEAEERNNAFLRDFKKPFQYVIDNCNPTSTEEIKTKGLAKDFSVQPSGMSMREFLTEFIHKERTEIQPNKHPSSNWQLYQKLLKKLEEEGNIVDMPISQITDREFEQFGNFLLKADGYEKNMRYFKTTINKAIDAKLTEVTLTYDYKGNGPLVDESEDMDSEYIHTLTKEQYRLFCRLDLRKALPNARPTNIQLYEMWRDFCVFVFESLMRPIDVFRLKVEQVNYEKEWISYIPQKKKNNKGDKKKKIVHAPLNSRAKAIIEKYKGKSAYGFVFPFSTNEMKEWDLTNPKEYARYYNAEQHKLQAINRFLKKLKPILGVNHKFTSYTFRHTVLTLLLQSGMNPMTLAEMAGTSVEMLRKHYFDVTNNFKAPEINLDEAC